MTKSRVSALTRRIEHHGGAKRNADSAQCHGEVQRVATATREPVAITDSVSRPTKISRTAISPVAKPAAFLPTGSLTLRLSDADRNAALAIASLNGATSEGVHSTE